MEVNNGKIDSMGNESKEEILRLLLNVNLPRIPKVFKKVLIEVLVNGKIIDDLRESLKLPKSRLKILYADGIKLLKLSLIELNFRLESLDKLNHELKNTKVKLQELEKSTKIEKCIPAELLKILSKKIVDAEFSSRVKNICNRGGIYTYRDVVRYSKTDFLKLRDCGKTSATEIEAYLYKIGLHWSMDV